MTKQEFESLKDGDKVVFENGNEFTVYDKVDGFIFVVDPHGESENHVETFPLHYTRCTLS